jgi:hypothetical protein
MGMEKEMRKGYLVKLKDEMKKRINKRRKERIGTFALRRKRTTLDERIPPPISRSSRSSMFKVGYGPHLPCQAISYFLHPHFASF